MIGMEGKKDKIKSRGMLDCRNGRGRGNGPAQSASITIIYARPFVYAAFPV